jgi:hypothetical protein
MTLPRAVADVIADHVSFQLECVDRMYCNVYVPNLQYPAGLVGYVHNQLELPIASTAPLGPVTDRFVRTIRRFAAEGGIPWVDFAKGERKDDVMHQYLAGFEAAGRTEGVLFVGRAQEKTNLFRTEKRRGADGSSYPWIVKTTGMVNQYYFYCVDADFGPFFLKFCSYFPYNAKLCINGHHWAQRQAAKAGIEYEAMDNAFAAVDDAAALQHICDGFGAEQIDALLRKWLARLPHPFSSADREAGYRYAISIWQAEFSVTQMLDRPVSGRLFFEQVIRDNLDIGRPDQVGLIFDKQIQVGKKRSTPGRFRTRVITAGVTPSLHVDYKQATIKQYHKEGRALRTETTINDPGDFRIGKGLTNLPALREVGFTANRRLLRVQRLDHNPIIGNAALSQVTEPATTDTGTRVPGIRLADRRSHALLNALVGFRLQPNGFTNADLRHITAAYRGLDSGTVTAGQMTYDLRRLRSHGLIDKIPHSRRYHVTDTGLTTAAFLTRIHDRLLPTGLAHLIDPTDQAPLSAAYNTFQHRIDQLTEKSGIATRPHPATKT